MADAFKRDQVVEIIGSVIKRMAGGPSDQGFLSEINALKAAIDGLYRDLGDVHPGDIKSHIPGATDELDAVVSTTEKATHTIMESCENIQSAISGLPADKSANIEAHITAIIEACTFQDLTGQRIKKIMKALNEIDAHAGALLKVLQSRFGELGPSTTKKPEKSDAEKLLNGPQLPGQGISQEEIDRLLNDFN